MEEEEKNKKTQREQAGEDEGRMRVLERVWIKKNMEETAQEKKKTKTKVKTKTYGRNESIEKRNNIKNKKF